MTLHLMKLAVGVDSIGHLAKLQERRLENLRQNRKDANLYHVTRNRPTRADELIEGGSMYWVVKRRIVVRQRLLDFEPMVDHEGRKACRIILDSKLVRTVPHSQRRFQGWRYLATADAPPDVPMANEIHQDLPPNLVEELRELGILY